MAVVPYSTPEDIDGSIRIITWPNMANSDTGQPYVGPHFADCSVQVFGTFGVGGNCRIQGTNESGTPAQWVPLADNLGNALDFVSLGGDVIREHMYQIRPIVTAGDGTTALTVKIMFTGSAQRWRQQGA